MAKKRYIIKPGQMSPGVKKWDTYMGIPYCIRNRKVQRVETPDTGYTDEDDIQLRKIQDKIQVCLNREATTKEHTLKVREKELGDLRAMESNLIERREKLTEWEDEQILRCLHGHGTLTGKHYFYYNFGFIQKVNKQGQMQVIRPDYRAIDDMFFRGILKAEEESSGKVIAKRRRVGYTWNMVADIAYDLIFHGSNVFFVSKDEEDQEKYFRRLKFFIERLPTFMRSGEWKKGEYINEYVRNAMDFVEYRANARIGKIKGLQDARLISNGIVRSASPRNVAAIEGDGCSKFIIDEAGKIDTLQEILRLGIPMLAGSDGLTRAGCLILGGTVGDMDGSGRIFKKVYESPKTYQVMPVFISGLHGVFMDEYGNDMPKKAQEFIEDRRKALEEEQNFSDLITFKQQYPLTIEEAFLSDVRGKVFPVDIIRRVEDYNKVNPPKIRYGMFRVDMEGPQGPRVVFEEQVPTTHDPDFLGHNQVQMIYPPEESIYRVPYVVGVDPIDMRKDKYKESGNKSRIIHSDFAFVVRKRAPSGLTNIPVCYFHGRPEDPETAFEQSFLASLFYFQAPINPERNKGHFYYSFALKNSALGIRFVELIQHGTGVALGIDQNEYNWGTNITDTWHSSARQFHNKWWKDIGKHDNMFHTIPVYLDETYDAYERNTDLLSADMLANQLCFEYALREAEGMPATKEISVTNDHVKIWENRQGAGWAPARGPSPALLRRLQQARASSRRSYGPTIKSL